MFQQTAITAFEGLQSTAAPDLIKDGEARDLINFRQETVGKLISRNGVVQGVFEGTQGTPYSEDVKSIHGIGEIILESEWALYGTDRFMVYGVQIGSGYYKYIFTPLDTKTGNPKSNVLITDFAWDFHTVDVHPHGSTTHLPLEVLGENFQRRFVAMNQFQRRLIIADPVNGDMQIVNKRDESETYPKPNHELELRALTLAEFDVNNVDVTYPDPPEGVTTGLALYRYALPKRPFKLTDDNFTRTIGDQKWWGGGERADKSRKALSYMKGSPDEKGFFTYIHYSDSEAGEGGELEYTSAADPSIELPYISDIHVNKKYPFVFSNAESAGEFDDVLGRVTLPTDEFDAPSTPPNGQGQDISNIVKRNKLVERVADVYLWEDYRLPYYRSAVTAGGETLLTGAARTWEKTVENVPRIIQLTPKKGSPEGRVPLAVWRYRFVWDFGNGNYSAPSAELPIADTLWSAVKDSDFYVLGGYRLSLPGNYRYPEDEGNDRPANIREEDFFLDSVQDVVSNDNDISLLPKLFTAPTTLSDLGLAVQRLKEKLYAPTHRFGAKKGTLNAISAGEFATLITADFGETVKMNGFIAQAADLWHSTIGTGVGKLVVPVLPNVGEPAFKNSLFTADGRYRFLWSREDFRWVLVVQGDNDFMETQRNGNSTIEWLYAHECDFVLNLLCPPADADNDSNTANPARLRTALRAVREESHYLTNVLPNVPAQVRERLVMSGIAELPLYQFGNPVGFMAKDSAGRTSTEDVLANYMGGGPLYRERVRGGALNTYAAPTQDNMWKRDGSVTGYAETPNEPRNLSAYLYGAAQRFVGVEQLTAAFPASLLFKAPRVKLTIPQADVPTGAKRLLIFRTRSTHDNYYDPNEWGLVDRVDVDPSLEFNYTDTTKDDDLDYTEDITQFMGLTVPLKSRYNIAANDRMYYLNYIETYQSVAPRGTVQADPPTAAYILAYRDGTGLRSRAVAVTPTLTETIDGKEIRVFSMLPTVPDGTVEAAELFRLEAGVYRKVAEVKPGDEGVVVDQYTTAELANLPVLNIDSLKPSIEHYESGVRYSEINKPNHIRLESGVEFNRGDGDEITGVEKIYGNLLIFKENSMHRIGVDGQNQIPFTRRDEISPDIGCIAPRTILNVNNTVYFLSWKGFFAFDNNTFQRMDGKFAEELRKRLYEDGQGVKNSWARFASTGYNAVYNEIYLNVPSLPERSFAYETTNEFPPLAGFDSSVVETIKGDVFVVSVDKGYATKFTYEIAVGTQPLDNDVLSRGRLYYTNSLGELRSAQMAKPISQNTATLYIEAPTESESDAVRVDDETVTQQVVRALFASKWFTGNQETFMKRVRKVVVNVASKRSKTIRIVSVPLDEQEDRVDALTNQEATVQEYTFPDPLIAPVPDSDKVRNIIEVIPTNDEANDVFGIDDIGKPIRFSVEIETKGRAQLNQLSFYWRPIKTHLH